MILENWNRKQKILQRVRDKNQDCKENSISRRKEMPAMLNTKAFICALNECLLNSYYVLSMVGCARNSMLSVTELLKSYSPVGKKRKHR